MRHELSYRDELSPKKASSNYVSGPEQQLLDREVDREIVALMTEICSGGWEMRHLRLATIIDRYRRIENRELRQEKLELVATLCRKYSFNYVLIEATKLLETPTYFKRLQNRNRK